MDIQGLSKIRAEVLQQVLSSGDDPFDIAFVKVNDGVAMCPIDLEGDFPPSYKHNARKEVLCKFLNKEIPQTKSVSELVYFSFDPILNVDYCFEVFPASKRVNLYIHSTSGIKVCEFKPYNVRDEERVEIERSIKAGKGQKSSFSTLKERFSKLLGSRKPEQLNVVHSSEPIEIPIGSTSSPNQHPAKTAEPKPQSNVGKSTFAEDVLCRLDNPKFQAMRASGIGFDAIKMTLLMFTNQMIARYPEWNGLFDFRTEKDHVCVICKKGFEDRITKMAIPCLWKRKSFIENCILFGVEKIIFLDSVNRTFDLLEVSAINPSVLKEG